MKRLISWLQQREQNRSHSPVSSVLEDVKEACVSSGAQMSGVDFVMRRYYGDYNH